MPLYTTEALILRTYKLGEVDRIVVFLTEDRGKRRGVAQRAHGPRTRFAGALEPMTRAGVAYFEKERRELVALNYAEPIASPLRAPRGGGIEYAGYFAELIDEWAPEADPNEKLYRLGCGVVDAMTHGVPIEPLARYFEYWLLRLQGVYPSTTACAGCGGPLGRDARGGAVLGAGDRHYSCPACVRPRGTRALVLSSEAVRFIGALGGLAPVAVGQLGASEQAIRELEAAHRELIATHLEKELKSVRVLRELRGH
ncbi:MAG: DNA repair protein RecO [Acidobacteriota bacterium]